MHARACTHTHTHTVCVCVDTSSPSAANTQQDSSAAAEIHKSDLLDVVLYLFVFESVRIFFCYSFSPERVSTDGLNLLHISNSIVVYFIDILIPPLYRTSLL